MSRQWLTAAAGIAGLVAAVLSQALGAQTRPVSPEVDEFVRIYLKNGGDKLTNWVQGDATSSPEAALRAFKPIAGLSIELVASEPVIRQPIDLHFDDRGRLWVVQYLQYPFPAGLTITSYDQYLRARYSAVPAAPPHHRRGADKITVLEDTNGDGTFDSHRDVISGLNITTSVLTGHGGIWVMSELIAARGGHPADVLFDVLLEEGGSVPTVFFHHSEPDMQLIMRQPWTSIGSDGTAVSPDGPTGRSHPHPRYYGTFPRVLGRYVRELKVITLPEAVKKMTSMNADKLGIADRGRLKEGLAADVTVFDQDRVIDRATFEQPHQFPVGIKYVIVNGVVTVDNEQHTGALAGRVLYGPGKQRPKS